MAIANITNNILTDSGVATSSLLTTSAAASTYLALAGGTLTGALGGTSALFSGNVGVSTSSALSLLSVGGAGYAGRAITAIANNADYAVTFRQDNASGGGLQIFTTNTSLGSDYIYGGDSVSVKFRITQTGSATFNSSIQAGSFINSNSNITSANTGFGNSGGFIINYGATAGSKSWRLANDLAAFGDFAIQQSTTQTGSTYSNILYLGASGAATFSSSVTTNANNYFNNTGGRAFDATSDGVLMAKNGGAHNIIFGDGNVRYYSLFTPSGAATMSIRNFSTSLDMLTFTTVGVATFTSSVTATSFFESSDIRLKTLIQDNYQTKGIGEITPKLYTKNGKVELGYYAQDFIGVLDNAVSKGSDDMLSLSYREVLVAKVYALEQEIKELKAKMN
jgi:hypothetical protein